MSELSVSYLWRERQATSGFTHGVSLHSHTNQSKETLIFIADFAHETAGLREALAYLERRTIRTSGVYPDFSKSFWTPPLTPRLAFELERDQIEQQLQLPALVSLSDHDDLGAPLLLRNLPSARHIPMSFEWTIPVDNLVAGDRGKQTAFHLGIHNLPSASAVEWLARLQNFTALPIAERPATLLAELLAELSALPNALVIFNHPLWDLYRIGRERHDVLANEFIARYGQSLHALELNGMRNWKENRQVQTLAAQWNQLTISGGDRHGVEPNANINLTHASTFNEFVHEVRRERKSHVLYMPQYAQPWKHRILLSTLDAIRNYPHFPVGSKRWDERVFHENPQGELRPLSAMWNDKRPPRYISGALACIRLLGRAPLSGGLKLAWDDSADLRAALSND